MKSGAASTAESMDRLLRCREHANLYRHQTNAYHDCRKHLSTGQLLILMDFTKLRLQVNIQTANDAEGKTVTDYVLVMECLDEKGERQHHNMDVLCDHAPSHSSDYYFLSQTWHCLLSTSLFSSFYHIILWSDGGPSQFPTRYTQFLFHLLSAITQKRITHHLFAAYHGHSMADGHAGHIKSVIRRAYIGTQGQRAQGQVVDGPADASDVQALLSKEGNTSVWLFPFILREPHLKPDVLPVPHISRYRCFDHDRGQLTMYARSNDSTCVGVPHVFQLRTLF
jgi:hypothetical protein